MKARTSGAGRTGCEAVQYSDQMQCARCGLSYDANDPDPPECRPDPVVVGRSGAPQLARQRARATMEALRRSLQN